MGTYSGVRIVRSATGLQEQDDVEDMIVDDREPSSDRAERLVTVLINRTGPPDLRMRNYLMGNSREESIHPSRHNNVDVGNVGDTVVFIDNRLRRSNEYVLNCMDRHQVPPDHKIHKNIPRLTHYIEEANVGRGFIKELGYSNDGRIICSPFKHGIRLFSFTPNCDELSSIHPPSSPGIRLNELATTVSHANIVLCTKFSPIHPLLVSGCLGGRIVWYQPRI